MQAYAVKVGPLSHAPSSGDNQRMMSGRTRVWSSTAAVRAGLAALVPAWEARRQQVNDCIRTSGAVDGGIHLSVFGP